MTFSYRVYRTIILKKLIRQVLLRILTPYYCNSMIYPVFFGQYQLDGEG
jgi:hypothetical protein